MTYPELSDPETIHTIPIVHQFVLFVGTTNVYRSRLAEALFNHLAEQRDLGLRARSAGLQPERSVEDTLSPFADAYLRSHQIPATHTSVRKSLLTENDLSSAHLVVALNEREHRPLLEKTHPESVLVEYWSVGDLSDWEPERTLDHIARQVEALIERKAGVTSSQQVGIQSSEASS